MNKEIKRQLLMCGILIIMISLTLVLWFDSFSFQTYTKITDEQLCYSYQDETLQIDGFELFYKNELLQTGGARFSGLPVLKNDHVSIDVKMTDDLVLNYKKTIKNNNEIIYLDYQQIEENIDIQNILEIPMSIKINRNNNEIYNEDIQLNIMELKTYTGSNKDYSISNAYLGNHWFKAGYFHCIDSHLDEKYENMIMDYAYLKDENEYTPFIHINGKTKEFLDGLTQVYFFDEQDNLKDKEIVVFITLKGEDEFTFRINLSPTINEGDKS